jgi:hypothetical protein
MTVLGSERELDERVEDAPAKGDEVERWDVSVSPGSLDGRAPHPLQRT